MSDNPSPVGHTKHGELTLDQIAEMMPGLGVLMREVGDRYWTAYYAAQAGNWDLAAHNLRGIRKRFAEGALTRPKYKVMLEEYTRRILEPLLEQCAAKDWSAFERQYQAGVELANQMHKATQHAYITWQLPAMPPPQLKL